MLQDAEHKSGHQGDWGGVQEPTPQADSPGGLEDAAMPAASPMKGKVLSKPSCYRRHKLKLWGGCFILLAFLVWAGIVIHAGILLLSTQPELVSVDFSKTKLCTDSWEINFVVKIDNPSSATPTIGLAKVSIRDENEKEIAELLPPFPKIKKLGTQKMVPLAIYLRITDEDGVARLLSSKGDLTGYTAKLLVRVQSDMDDLAGVPLDLKLDHTVQLGARKQNKKKEQVISSGPSSKLASLHLLPSALSTDNIRMRIGAYMSQLPIVAGFMPALHVQILDWQGQVGVSRTFIHTYKNKKSYERTGQDRSMDRTIIWAKNQMDRTEQDRNTKSLFSPVLSI